MKNLVLFLAFCCASLLRAQAYSYSDGNGNLYAITSDKVDYIPVKKENSSSGTYSGGKEKTVQLKSKDFENLKSLLEEGIKAVNYDQKRELGTAEIHKADKAGSKAILTRDSELKAKIEKQLKLIMK